MYIINYSFIRNFKKLFVYNQINPTETNENIIQKQIQIENYIDLSKERGISSKEACWLFSNRVTIYNVFKEQRIQKSLLRNITGFARRICSFLYNENASIFKLICSFMDTREPLFAMFQFFHLFFQRTSRKH